MRKVFLLGIVGLVVVVGSFTLGYFVADRVEKENEQEEPDSIPDFETSKAPVAEPHSSGEQQPVSVLDLAGFERFSSFYQRSLALHDLIANADQETLLQHFEQATDSLGEDLKYEAQFAIVQRLAAIDPMAALETIDGIQSEQSNALVSAIYGEWALADLDQAVGHVRSLDIDSKKIAVKSIVRARDDLTPQQRREMARGLGMEWLAVEVMEREANTPSIQDPQREWSVLVGSNSETLESQDDAQQRMVAHIARAWVLRDGVGAFDKVVDSLSSQSSLWKLSDQVTRGIADSDPQLAFDLAIHLRTLGVIGIVDRVLVPWSRNDPWSALNAVNAVETKFLRRTLQTEVLQTWANTDPKTLLNGIGGLPDQLQTQARKIALISLSKSAPQEAAELIGGIEEQAVLNEIANAIVMSWAKLNISEVLNWIESDTSLEHSRDELRTVALSGLASSDPQEALQIALAQPLNDDGIGAEADVVSMVAFRDVDTAVSMLGQVRSGKTKIEAYDSVILMLAHIAKDSDRAVDLFVQVCNQESIPRDASIILNVVISAPRMLADELNRIESEDTKRKVASTLLRFHEDDGIFTEDQLSRLRDTSQYGREGREAKRQTALENLTELLMESSTTDESESE